MKATEEELKYTEEELWRELCQSGVPPHIHNAIVRHVMWGAPVGGFVSAVAENNLREAFGQADDENGKRLKEIVAFWYNYCPAECWGSPARVAAWRQSGGLFGQRTKADA